jgi:Predicted bile acid beta-glucosidase
MKEKKGRRSFLKNFTVGGIGIAVAPASLSAQSDAHAHPPLTVQSAGATRQPAQQRKYNDAYTGEYLNRVAFPIGGLGAGMFCLEGTGAISHMSLWSRPDLFHEPAVFAAIAVKGVPNGAKVIEGQVPEWKMLKADNYGGGGAGATYGLPRFNEASFLARFPFATINYKDSDIPLAVQLTGWSPFIPTDADNSSLPVAALEYKFTNTGSQAVEAVFSYNAKHFVGRQGGGKRSIRAYDKGFIMFQEGTTDKPFMRGEFAVYSNEPGTLVDHCWFRGGWWDPVTMVWNTIRDVKTKTHAPVEEGAPGASLYVPFTLQPGQSKTIRVMMAWYMPETDLRAGPDAPVDKDGCADCCIDPQTAGLEKLVPNPSRFHKPWYSSKFNSVEEVAGYWQSNYDDLYKKSNLFKDTFYASTLPAEVIEAVAANLSILKSPTVLRQFDGRLWNYEGVLPGNGCCDGSCTHVWNYAQAVAHLFPALERSLRHTEFCENQNKEGHQGFRASLPIRPVKHDFHAAADGQLGGIMKVYREWRISGNNDWLAKMYPMVKKSMDYCIATWDPAGKGIVEEPHHNTYDIEFWGPNGMCTSFYLGALMAIQEMGKFLKKDVSVYKKLYTKGKQYMEEALYDGEYFFQKIQWTGLKAPNPVESQSFHTSYSEEALEVLKKEGPKYQYGVGCLSDGVLGAWIARVCGLNDPVDTAKIKSHLLAVHKYNLKQDLSDHANPQRPTYAMGHEGGLLLCTWPKGGKLSLPFVYSDEVWTGIEYQVASHLMLLGETNKALEIVRTCRNRYDGRRRNPFNEFECGSWYGRALSSYGMLQGLTGVRYDAVDKTLYIDSQIGDFTSFLSTETGFGTVTYKQGKPVVKAVYGTIPVKRFMISGKQIKA